MSSRTLRKSSSVRMLTGVSGGVAEYFDIDAVLVRLGWIVACFLTAGLALLPYVALAIIMPIDELGVSEGATLADEESEGEAAGRRERGRVGGRRRRGGARRGSTFGLILIVLGTLALTVNLGIFSWFRWDILWPVAIIGTGAAVLFGGMRRN